MRTLMLQNPDHRKNRGIEVDFPKKWRGEVYFCNTVKNKISFLKITVSYRVRSVQIFGRRGPLEALKGRTDTRGLNSGILDT